MDEAEIQQEFARAGWELDDSFYEHLTIGYTEDLPILAYRQAWESRNLEFQLCDYDKDLSCWVREIPTSQRAAQLLEEHGEPIIEE
jgi:hypothetical protein